MTDAKTLRSRVGAHLALLYPAHDIDELVLQVLDAIGLRPSHADATAPQHPQRWNEADAVLITYGDSIVSDGQPPLAVLDEVLRGELADLASVVHVLPFFPYSSDRGFSVIDHTAVDPALGSWGHIDAIAAHTDLMADLVINHISVNSAWFRQFVADQPPGREYILVADAGTDVSNVVRPRALPLLHPIETAAGERLVWCTFSADQADLDVANPAVLCELLRIVDVLVRHGARFLRLDAIAYLWKRSGTPCIHLPETHEVVRLLHTLLEARSPRTAIITETNVPNAENLSYFGSGDEAHLVYNFTLPPLVIDAMARGRSDRLVRWLRDQPDAPPGCTYLNFLSSHDGIGVRPAEGLLTDDDIDALVKLAHRSGGLHGSYARAGSERPYELNVTLWDLLSGTSGGPDDLGFERFRCAHALMLSLRGVPALYVNSVFGTPNDAATATRTGVRRDISRARVDLDALRDALTDPSSITSRVLAALTGLVRTRRAQPAFHPDAPQRVLDLGPAVFALERTDLAGSQRIIALYELAGAPAHVPPGALEPPPDGRWHDLLTGEHFSASGDTISLAAYGVRWLTNPSP
ncbi:MAG: hypothetical protein KDB21_19570 [Acidimicrobiales bacterium]|nr:hypothetical protein [Acidimicrobiales bacterium]